MPQNRPDRDLRRAVARLRSLPHADFDAILASLEGSQRSRVLGLLDQLEGRLAAWETEADVAAGDVVVPSDLSAWLVARVNGRGDDGDETIDRFEITGHAQRELRRCAAALVPQSAPRTTSLVGRIAGLMGRQAA